jgi:hypothetical protein
MYLITQIYSPLFQIETPLHQLLLKFNRRHPNRLPFITA